MSTANQLFKDWGPREVYPITEDEFHSLLNEEGQQVWAKKNVDNKDGTFTNELKIGEGKFLIVTQKKL